MRHRIILTGEKFGKLTVVEELKQQGLYHLKCLCQCGKIVIRSKSSITSGNTQSCGCLKAENLAIISRKFHSLAPGQGALRTVYYKYKSAAKRKKVPISFDISQEQFADITSKPCFYCGCLPATNGNHGHNNGDFVYNGLDRVDSKRGYTLDNVVPCCATCNRAKLAMSITDFYAWIKRVSTHLNASGYAAPTGI